MNLILNYQRFTPSCSNIQRLENWSLCKKNVFIHRTSRVVRVGTHELTICC